VKLQLAGDLVMIAMVARVFGADAQRLLRRIAAAGVRLGASELAQSHSHNQQEGDR
jgi:hypothetical protein